MEIRDPVHGSIYFSDGEVKVLDSPEYQRLRAIKQLGFAEFSFPGATHNRYLHSIGVCHLAGLIFDSIFKVYPFEKPSSKFRFRQIVRLGALLHDLGHGPLSHTTEQVMPMVDELKVGIYKKQNFISEKKAGLYTNRRANHEDYTLKILTESPLTQIIQHEFKDIEAYHIACLIDKNLQPQDQFFIDHGNDLRPILSQIVSSELDADRMDYLERDSYFCGTNYGKIDTEWLVQNMTFLIQDRKLFLALNRRALYSFDDFLISRHHMHLMVYFHHKSIIYEEMLNKYLTSEDCNFQLPADFTEYLLYTDYKLHEHLSQSRNIWAQRIAQRTPYKVLIELHNTKDSTRPSAIQKKLEESKIESIWASSKTRLSKYHSASEDNINDPIFVVDQYDHLDIPAQISQSTEIFSKYEGTRIIDRIYVDPKDSLKAKNLIQGL
ncbi:MAG: HD domain-containing protein [Pseudobdellovibrionaceae bacterium]